MERVDLDELLTEYVTDTELKDGEMLSVELYGRKICDVEVKRSYHSIEFKIIRIY